MGSTGRRGDSLERRGQRISAAVDQICEAIVSSGADLAVIEGPAYSKTMGSMHDRSGLWWGLVLTLQGHGMPVLEVPSSVRQKYATGKGNAAKDVVMIEAVKRYPAAGIRNNNEADAVVLAAIGARMLGQPLEASLPAKHLEALRSLVLPELVAVLAPK